MQFSATLALALAAVTAARSMPSKANTLAPATLNEVASPMNKRADIAGKIYTEAGTEVNIHTTGDGIATFGCNGVGGAAGLYMIKYEGYDAVFFSDSGCNPNQKIFADLSNTKSGQKIWGYQAWKLPTV